MHAGRWCIRIERERSVQRGDDEPSAQERDVVVLDRVTVAELHREGRAAGLTPAGAREIPATREHVASEVVLLRA